MAVGWGAARIARRRGLEHADQGGKRHKRTGAKRIAHARRVDLACDHAGVFQNAQMFRHCGLRKPNRAHDIAPNAARRLRQQPQDAQPGRMPQGFRQRRKLRIFRVFELLHHVDRKQYRISSFYDILLMPMLQAVSRVRIATPVLVPHSALAMRRRRMLDNPLPDIADNRRYRIA